MNQGPFNKGFRPTWLNPETLNRRTHCTLTLRRRRDTPSPRRCPPLSPAGLDELARYTERTSTTPEAAAADSDPVLALLDNAPVVEATEEELAAFDVGLAEIRAGRGVPAKQVREMLDARTDKAG
jgi:predicted transcriptional regulator